MPAGPTGPVALVSAAADAPVALPSNCRTAATEAASANACNSFSDLEVALGYTINGSESISLIVRYASSKSSLSCCSPSASRGAVESGS